MSIVTGLWARQPGEYFFVSTKSGIGTWEDHAFARGEWREVDNFIKLNRDKDIYFCPHGFNQRVRRKNHAVMPSMLWSDMDEVNPSDAKLKPTIAIESSPGRYVGLWLCDKIVNENLNQRLSYYIGADAGGWDLTQVLRVPGTLNYKYESTPKVRLLWDDGATYKINELESLLPNVETRERENVQLPDVLPEVSIDELSAALRNTLKGIHRQPDRSLRLTIVARSMLHEGYEPAEVASVLMTKDHPVSSHVWDQKNPRRAVARAIGAVMKEASDSPEPDINGRIHRLFGTPMSLIEPEQTKWLWYPFFALGEVTIVNGDPGSGKSYLLQMIGKATVDSDTLPPVHSRYFTQTIPQIHGKVFFADFENSPSTVTANRLNWAGCRHREKFFQEPEPFSLTDRKKKKSLYEALERERPVLVVFDTVYLYMGGGVDTDKASETTSALAVFKDIAQRFNCAVCVVRHLTKGGKEKDIYRGQGSIAFTAHCRIEIGVGHNHGAEDENERVMKVMKTNLSPESGGISFCIETAPTLREPVRASFHWGKYGEFNDIFAAPGGHPAEEKNTAKDFIQRTLEEGPIEASRIEKKASAENISRATLYRAAKEMNVKRIAKMNGNWRNRQMMWSLSSTTTQD